jgi:hypothetical protein
MNVTERTLLDIGERGRFALSCTRQQPAVLTSDIRQQKPASGPCNVYVYHPT